MSLVYRDEVRFGFGEVRIFDILDESGGCFSRRMLFLRGFVLFWRRLLILYVVILKYGKYIVNKLSVVLMRNVILK